MIFSGAIKRDWIVLAYLVLVAVGVASIVATHLQYVGLSHRYQAIIRHMDELDAKNRRSEVIRNDMIGKIHELKSDVRAVQSADGRK